MPSAGYEFLEHTADLRFRSYGKTVEECFSNACRAMYASIVDAASVAIREERAVRAEAASLDMLLHDWLTEALLLFEMEGVVFREFSVSIKEGKNFLLEGTLSGEKYDPKKHDILLDIKAVTYHGLSVKKEKDRWVAEVLCDI